MKPSTMASRVPTDAVVALCYSIEITWCSGYGPMVVEIPQTILRSGCWDFWPPCGYNPRCALMVERGVKPNSIPWPEHLLGPRAPPKKNGTKFRARQARARRERLGQAQDSEFVAASSDHLDLWSWELAQTHFQWQ